MAQEAFYLNMGLPVYVRTASSDSFAASVVEDGHALLFYNGTKLRAKLSSGNYMDVGGSSSTDFSVVTAAVDDVLSPKQFYNNAGNLVTGNIPTVTASLDGNTVHIPKGYIAASDSITVSGGGGDADVTLGVIDANGHFQKLKFNGTDASNSGSAQSVSSYYTWNSTLPAPTPSGSMDFYQCASVSSGTWTGYKAVLSGGSYSLESTVTSGLTYGSGFIPQVGQIYADGALVRVASLYGLLPTNGLIFYAPLATSAGTAATGQTLTIPAGATFETVAGIPCVTLSEAQITAPDTGMPEGDHAVSLSIWIRYSDLPYNWAGMIDYGTGGAYGNSFSLFTDPDNQLSAGGYGITVGSYTIITDTWYHAVAVYDGSDVKLYINGAQEGSSPETLGIVLAGTIKIGNTTGAVLSIAGARIYNRALTASEIAQLAAEFTPTT